MWFLAPLMAGFIVWRGILILRIRRKWKILLCLAVLAASFKFQIVHVLGGPMFFAPDLPGVFLLIAAFCYAVVFLYFLLLVPSELVHGVFSLWLRLKNRKNGNMHQIFLWVNGGLFLLSVFLAGYGIAAGTAIPDVRIRQLTFPDAPAGGLRIAVLADLHADRLNGEEKMRRIVEKTNALSPDAILIAGDFVDGKLNSTARALRPLSGLRARYGVFGVPGNHEYYSGFSEWTAYLSTLGVVMLNNSNCVLPDGQTALLGVTDPAAGRTGREMPDLKKSLSGVETLPFKILLAHRPEGAREAAKYGIRLQISGHTHGGLMPGMNMLIAKFNGGFVSGLYSIGQMKLYVSNGSGIWSGFPVRIGMPSEIVLFEISRPDGKK